MKSTPIFIAVTLALGDLKDAGLPQFRDDLPEMKPATKYWYTKTYGQGRYDRYWGCMEKLDEFRKCDPEKYSYSHRAFHDAESFAWIIVYELIRAWPEGFEEELTKSARYHISVFEEHRPGGGSDSRTPLIVIGQSGWEDILHPRLTFLAPMIKKLVKYFSVEWLLWPELPEDHGHEAVKILLREAISDMKEKNDPIALKQELRYQSRN